jgi:hypothetical protein
MTKEIESQITSINYRITNKITALYVNKNFSMLLFFFLNPLLMIYYRINRIIAMNQDYDFDQHVLK